MAESRRERLARSRLYVVTGARERQGDLERFLDAVLGAGADLIQLREKDAEAGELLRWGRTFAEAARDHGALFVLNDRPDVAMMLGADGVHVGQGDLTPSQVRGLTGPDMLIGLSTHAADQLAAADAEADYLCAGPVWETPTKPGRPAAGIGYVAHAATHAAGRPWFAIGGITTENVAEVAAAGARRIVVVRAVTEAADPAAAVCELLAGLPEL